MRSRRSISRSRWLLAIACSLVIHLAMVGSWFGVKPIRGGPAEVPDTLVDSPDDDRETTIVLRDQPIRIIKTIVVPTPKREDVPAPLPKKLPIEQGSNPELKPANYSPEQEPSSPLPANIPKLHGRVKSGKTIVYLLDCSSSMGGCIQRAKATLQESLKQLGPECRFQLVAYNGGATGCFTASRLPDEDNLAAADQWLKNLVAEGRSDHLKGFREALSVQPDAIFLLTDADDFDEKEVKAILAITPPTVFVNAAIFGSPMGIPMVTPLEYLTRRLNGSIRWYPGR
ncbi:VWA domain-containing protein [Zavarzinella formosa]|uniref:VWA domain-containing protein n=1 Tax=Zavarzinella formosa TaxID=360055 RepID=UPI00037EA60E|nr:VWA domain-containing protein [Zavarzinella formosa]